MAGILLKYYQDELAVIFMHMKLLDEAVSMHDVHRIRVGIKRIKAINRMLGASYPDKFKAKQLNRPFKIVFKTLGVYRETTLSINILRRLAGSYKIRRGYIEYMQPLLKEIRDDIKAATQKFDFQETIDDNAGLARFLGVLQTEEEISMLSRYIDNQRVRALSLLQQGEGYEELHPIRIVLKNIKPFLKMLALSADSRYALSDYKLLNRAESLIGDWHDRRVLSDSLEEYIKVESEQNNSIIRSYNRVIKRIERKDNKNLKSIRAKILASLDALE
jgi:CHAD domain-containing protein